MTTDHTPPQRQAAFFTALAGHMQKHPGLRPVTVDPGCVVYIPIGHAADGRDHAQWIAAWMRSVGAVYLLAALFPDGVEGRPGYASVHAANVIVGGETVLDLWGTVSGLEVALADRAEDPEDWLRRIPLTVDELEYFAAHGDLCSRPVKDGAQ